MKAGNPNSSPVSTVVYRWGQVLQEFKYLCVSPPEFPIPQKETLLGISVVGQTKAREGGFA